MNSVLAQIYGTGFEKQASDEDLDLNQISGAQLLELLAAEEQEKVADDGDLDLSQLSGRELLELYAEAEDAGDVGVEQENIEKMAADGSLDYFDMAGRIQAHAYWDELQKVASEDDGLIEVDLDSISGDELMELMEEGYEFLDDDDFEKDAMPAMPSLSGVRNAARSGVARFEGAVGRQVRRVGPADRYAMRAGTQSAKNVRKQTIKKLRTMGAKPAEIKKYLDATSSEQLKIQDRAARLGSAAATRRLGRGALGAAAGTAAAGTAAAGTAAAGTAALGLGAAGLGAAGLAAGTAGAAGGAYYMKKKKKGPWGKGGRFSR